MQDIFRARAAETALLEAAGAAAELEMMGAAAALLAEAGEGVAMGAFETLTAGEALKHGLALGVDLAAVELRPLFLVADDLVGLIDFREVFLRLRIVLVLIRVVLLGQLAKSRFDFLGLRRFGDAQHAIGIAHIIPLSGRSARRPSPQTVNDWIR